MTSKMWGVVVVFLGLCCVIAESKVQNYNQYKVLKVTPNERDRPRVTHFLESSKLLSVLKNVFLAQCNVHDYKEDLHRGAL